MKNSSKIYWLTTLALLGFVVFSFTGCAPPAANYDPLDHIPLKNNDGIKYKLVKIEGRTFVGTQNQNGDWTLAGPID